MATMYSDVYIWVIDINTGRELERIIRCKKGEPQYELYQMAWKGNSLAYVLYLNPIIYEMVSELRPALLPVVKLYLNNIYLFQEMLRSELSDEIYDNVHRIFFDFLKRKHGCNIIVGTST